MQTVKTQNLSRSLLPEEVMQKTGIESIDKFFNYGERAGAPKIPFLPLIGSVIEMFQSQYTEALHDRKAQAIIKFCEERPQGFFYEEVEGLTTLFELAKNDLEKGVEEMIPALQALLAVDCLDPTSMFNRNVGSDQLRYMRQVPAFLTSLEYLFIYSDRF